MSFSALIIPEDPTNNGYILDPLIERMLAECGKPNAKVEVLRNPKTQGYEHAKALLLGEVLDRYRHKNLLLFLPDADGKDRAVEFLTMEQKANNLGVRLICCAAQQEVEAWLLTGHLEKLDTPWQSIRADISLKENVFEPFLTQHGDSRRAGGGRDLLMQQTLQNYQGLLQRCPELAELEQRMRNALAHS